MNFAELRKAIVLELVGIDRRDIDDPEGWWETWGGAEFGAKVLARILSLVDQCEREHLVNVDRQIAQLRQTITNMERDHREEIRDAAAEAVHRARHSDEPPGSY